MTEIRMETVDGARARIRRRALDEVRRRGRRRVTIRGSAIAVLAVAALGIGLAGLVGEGREGAGGGPGGSEAMASGEQRQPARVRWVQTDWSIGERTAARGAGLVRWVSDGDFEGAESAGS